MELAQGDRPPKVLILPKDVSPESRICTLAHPRTLTPCRYFFDPEKGLFELTSIKAPRSTCRSWLIGRQMEFFDQKNDASLGMAVKNEKTNLKSTDTNERPISDGYTVKDAEMLIATPIDHLFLLLPSFLFESSSKSPVSKRHFLSVDDLWEKLSEVSRHFDIVSSYESMHLAMEQRLKAVCDSVDAGNEKMYRLSDEKLLDELLRKARAVVARGLPASIEEHFVRRALETPVIFMKHEESSAPHGNTFPNLETTTGSNVSEAVVDSQASVASAKSTASALSTTTEITIPEDNILGTSASELYHLMRLRTALTNIISSYVPSAIAGPLNTLISSGKSQVDFKLLNEHLANISKMRTEALTSQSLGDFSRKRSMSEDDDTAEKVAEKKRKQVEDERKMKASKSKGVRDLKKVDTMGMKKMSHFFGKATAARKT